MLRYLSRRDWSTNSYELATSKAIANEVRKHRPLVRLKNRSLSSISSYIARTFPKEGGVEARIHALADPTSGQRILSGKQIDKLCKLRNRKGKKGKASAAEILDFTNQFLFP